MCSVTAVRQALKVADIVVTFVLVAVVNIVTVWDRASLSLPYSAVQAKRALRPDALVRPLVVAAFVAVPRLPSPSQAAIAHSSSPVSSWSNLVQPDARYTGWSAVPTKSSPALVATRPTAALRTLFASTRRGPLRVNTREPGRKVSIGRAPSGVATCVPATKHQIRVCCGPRKRSGSSAEKPRIVAPLDNVIIRSCLLYFAIEPGVAEARMPAGPSKQVWMTSERVGAITALGRRLGSSIASS